MLEAAIARWGYLAIGVGTFLEGETILVAAGALAHQGLLSLPWVMVWAFVGSVTGDQLWFQLGRRLGPRLLARHPSWQPRVNSVQQRLDRRGNAFVFGFRFLYGVRTVTPALLGIHRYPVAKFTGLNLAGAALWVVALASGGWGLGASFASVLARALRVEEVLGVALVVLVTSAIAWRMLARRRSRANAESAPAKVERASEPPSCPDPGQPPPR